MSQKKNLKSLSYQQAMQELEGIVEEIEGDTLDVDALSQRVQQALQLITYCREKLRSTDSLIQQAFQQDQATDTEE